MDSSLIDTFRTAIEAVAGHAHTAQSTQDVVSIVKEVVREIGATRIALSQVPRSIRTALEAYCAEAGLTLLAPPFDPESLPDLIDTAQIGITGAAFAIAETGTLAEVATDDATRLVSSLPRTYIGIVNAGDIVPTLRDSAARMRDIFLQHSQDVTVSFISGPSRTGDIEMILTLGVHGPERAHAILMTGDHDE